MLPIFLDGSRQIGMVLIVRWGAYTFTDLARPVGIKPGGPFFIYRAAALPFFGEATLRPLIALPNQIIDVVEDFLLYPRHCFAASRGKLDLARKPPRLGTLINFGFLKAG